MRSPMPMLLAALATLALASCASQSAPSIPIVAVEQGRLQGEPMPDGTTTFRAVPFAAPPVGDLRWRPPQDAQSWSGIRFRPGAEPACPQVDQGWNHRQASNSSEDCLYLGIRTPTLNPRARLPVMVMIHGGGNVTDSGAVFLDTSLPANENVVLVSVEYRMGVFGFLSHPALSAESGYGGSGNYALMDQIKALEWVRDNIAQFGGDPSNVTIFGNSAGGMDVGMLMVSPLARSLFHKAIEQSGVPLAIDRARSLSENEAIGETLARRFTQASGPAALSAMRAATAPELLAAGEQLGRMRWVQSVVDGHVLPEAPEVVFAAGRDAPVPLIVGVSVREFSMPTEGVDAMVTLAFGANADAARAAYGYQNDQPPPPDPMLGDIALQVTSDMLFRCPSVWQAQMRANSGHPVWLYQLDVNDPSEGGYGRHGSELHYIFLSRPEGVSEAQWPPLQAYWAQFARTGNPNREGLTLWDAHGGGANFMEFTPEGPVVRQHLRKPICDLMTRP